MGFEFDEIEFNERGGIWYLTVGWGFYCKTFTGEEQVDCINQLIAWYAAR